MGQAIPTGGSYPWGGNTYDAMKMETSDSMRHSNSSKMYKSVDSSKGNLGDLTLAKTNRLFIAYWWKPVVDPMDIGGSDKFVRAGEDSGMHFSWTQHQAHVYAPDYCGNTWRDTVPYPGNVNDWNLHEVLIDSSNLRYTIKVNGTLFYDNISWSGCSASMNYVGSIGWDANELYYTLSTWMDDIYVDDSFQRVAICSESTLGSPPYHCEFQPATSWNDTSITITLNRGSFGSTDSAYLYVFNSSNTASSGYAITFGSGGGGDTTAPTVSISTSDPSSTTSKSFTIAGTSSDTVGVTEVT